MAKERIKDHGAVPSGFERRLQVGRTGLAAGADRDDGLCPGRDGNLGRHGERPAGWRRPRGDGHARSANPRAPSPRPSSRTRPATSSFRTSRRTRTRCASRCRRSRRSTAPMCRCSPGSRMSIGTLTIDVGGTTEVVTVTGESPLIQATTGERSFSITTDNVTNLPLASRSYDSLLGLAPGIQTSTGLTFASRIGGGGDSNFMLDGATAMDPGVNRRGRQGQRRGRAGSHRRDVDLPGRIRAVERPADQRRHEERHQPVPRLAVRRGAPRPVEREEQDADSAAISRSRSRTSATGASRSAVRSASPAAATSCSSSSTTSATRGRRARSRATSGSRPLLERQGDFSQTTDNNGNPYPYIKDPRLTGACNATSQVACFADGGVLGRIPEDRLVRSRGWRS